jgi:hypothetical protein
MASSVPHGVIEIPAILLATALGLTLGMESLRWLLRREPGQITVVRLPQSLPEVDSSWACHCSHHRGLCYPAANQAGQCWLARLM